jgi:hypothetical protein
MGHSCGATFAFQTIFLQVEAAWAKSRAVVGIAGLYDLKLLRDMDPEPPMCQNFLSAAFGSDEKVWEDASPVRKDYQKSWDHGKVVILATCRADEYVSLQQQSVMASTLQAWCEDDDHVLRQ